MQVRPPISPRTDTLVPYTALFRSKRFHFRADWAACGRDFADMPALPGHNAGYDQADGERPFRLVAAPARSFLNTTFTETPGSLKREKRPTLLIHPAAAADLGVEIGRASGRENVCQYV